MILGVIPARYASTRFPGKPLVGINGKSMIQRVYEQCKKSPELSEVIVATDDERIVEHVLSFGGKVEITGDHHVSGTERIAEVASRHPEFSHIINIQGDEPYIDPNQISLLCQTLTDAPHPDIATLIRPLTDASRLIDPNVVKVVKGNQGQALYFSRAAIPFFRNDPNPENWLKQAAYFQHIGIYGFRREMLMSIPDLPASALEQAESLEQLRWLTHGFSIQTAISIAEAHAVDTPEDLERLTGLGE